MPSTSPPTSHLNDAAAWTSGVHALDPSMQEALELDGKVKAGKRFREACSHG